MGELLLTVTDDAGEVLTSTSYDPTDPDQTIVAFDALRQTTRDYLRDHLRRAGVRTVYGDPYPHHDPTTHPDDCPARRWHDREDGSCRTGRCQATHYTTCSGCDEQTIPVINDGAPEYHDQCDPEGRR